MKLHGRAVRNGMRVALVAAVMAALDPVLGVAAAQEQQDPLADAEASYVFEDYHRALNLLADLELEENLGPAVGFELQVLKGRCLVRLGQNELAAEAFCEAHAINRDWLPGAEGMPDDEATAFTTALATCPRDVSWWKKPVVWLVGGATAVVAYLLIRNNDDEIVLDPNQDLPDPPGPPTAR